MIEKPQWLVREEAGIPVLVALALRQRLGIRIPEELPTLRDHPLRAFDDGGADDALARQWRAYWDMTVEPETHPSGTPLELVDGFDTIVALPAAGAERLRAAIADHPVNVHGLLELKVSASFGWAPWTGEETGEALVGRADAALYAAKNGGRDRVVAATPVAVPGARADAA